MQPTAKSLWNGLAPLKRRPIPWFAGALAQAGLLLSLVAPGYAQIVKPADAPQPLSAGDAGVRFKVPPGFQVELVASEPLIQEPSGVCWDARGQMFVCELHGYNLEGQYDIEELNKTGQLDRVVQRIQADERHKKAAEPATYGTIKLLHDSDGDGRMDRAQVWADRLPPCLGICPSRGGIIAACKTQILFLADRDGDGQAEVKDVLFEGFKPGPLERSINCPQLGPDNWVYFGRGAGGGTIRGKYLTAPIELPNTDFRIRPDGSAIEPVVGNTGTMGFTFTESEDRFVISTNTPGNFVAPIEWRYLARNPDVAAPTLQQNASSDQRVYPTSQPHPWRIKRADDPGFSKLYTDRYGIAESAPNGYFTSACSPLCYQDIALPGLRGQLLACEPAQNFVHRALVQRDGARLLLKRPADEAQSEFLTSNDPWFHAISLSHTPDGSIAIVDFYREIIEDYSAIPRYLQQQYGLVAGRDFGRIWRLTHSQSSSPMAADMHRSSPAQLADELASPLFWRRTTARRLLLENQSKEVAPRILEFVQPSREPAVVMNALRTLEGLNGLSSESILMAFDHSDPSVRRLAVRLAEPWFERDSRVLERGLALVNDPEPMVRLQLALSLGESRDARILPALERLCRQHGSEPWMTTAVLSSLPQRSGALLKLLLEGADPVAQATSILEPLCTAIATRHDPQELSQALERIGACQQTAVQIRCLNGLKTGIKGSLSVELSENARRSVRSMVESSDAELRSRAASLFTLLRLETSAERLARLEMLQKQLRDVQLPTETHLSAVAQLASEEDSRTSRSLLEAYPSSTPQVREAILNSILSRRDRLPLLLDAIEQKRMHGSLLSAVQRATLIDSKDPAIRQRAATLLSVEKGPDREVFARYAEALRQPRDVQHGQQVFRDKCGNCHQAHGFGLAVGPDLNAEFQRAEETILKDVLAPSETISAGYVTQVIATTSGQVFSGIMASETPTSLNLLQAGGKQDSILRRDVEELKAIPVSLMPEDLIKSVSPQDLADLLAWLRQPSKNLVLLDENPSIVAALNEGTGSAELTTADKHSGQYSLRITPPQRYAPRIFGWEYRIRENPQPGEYRYLRMAWKSAGSGGVMLELAANGQWPPADKAVRRYHAGRNSTPWKSLEVASENPVQWTVVLRDLWKDFGDFTITGIAPTATQGPALFDRIELLREMPVTEPVRSVLSKPASARAIVRQIVGHRGSCADRPENTLASIRRAIEVGATAVEVDVRRTGDGALVLMHDESVDKTTNGRGKVSQHTLEAIRQLDAGGSFAIDKRFAGERVPTLAEALGECRGKVDILLDLKEQGADYDQAVIQAVKQFGDPKRTIAGVRSLEQAKRFRQGLPDARSLGLIGKTSEIEAYVAVGVDTIRLWTYWLAEDIQLVQRVRKAGAKLHLGVIAGTPDEVLPLLPHRPESMSADSPATLIATLDSTPAPAANAKP